MNFKKLLGLAAVAGLLAIAAPGTRAEAASLIQPGIAASIQDSAASTIEVRGRHHRGHRFHGHRHGHRFHARRHYGPRFHAPRHYGHRHHGPRHYGYGRRW